ncbi:unnamed protein product [Adineta steineri]|uniref:Uncharacterized protein n=1 Tax=Adineta steineri TaxID=433720 RepID=A0A815ZYI1_9BILA|nr:unnamed protein product [Adineta steineri]CAF1589279.1 unnamed protein product [Adineta steineri]
MTSNTVPIYRQGRKFYVSTEEYARIRSEDRRQRRTAVQKSQNLPISKYQQTSMRMPSASFYSSIHRTNSNPYEQFYEVLKKPHLPANSLINAVNRYEPNRLSRSMLRRSDDQNNLLTIPLTASRKSSLSNIRSSSSDKILDLQRISLPIFDTDNEVKQSLSDEIVQPSTLSPQQSPSVSHRPISDYGISPITAISMTPTDQTHTQTNASKFINYLTRMKHSSLNPSSQPSSPAISGTGSFLETGIQGSDHGYSVLGSSFRRVGTGLSSLVTRSASDNNKNRNLQDNLTNDPLSDDNNSSIPSSTVIQQQQQKIDLNPYRQLESIGGTDEDSGQQRGLWTRSTHRSQSTDGLTEKKRVRFADMEGLTLEFRSDKNRISSSVNNQSLTRRPHIKYPSDLRGRPRPFYNTLNQTTTTTTTTKTNESKLATDV